MTTEKLTPHTRWLLQENAELAWERTKAFLWPERCGSWAVKPVRTTKNRQKMVYCRRRKGHPGRCRCGSYRWEAAGFATSRREDEA